MSKQPADTSRSARAQEIVRAKSRSHQRRNLLIGGGVIAALIALVVGVAALSGGRDITGEAAQQVPDGVTEKYGVAVGAADAGTEIVIYEDPQCPACRDFEAAVAEQLASAVEDGSVRVEYRVVSFLDRASTDDYSSRAANALAVVQHVAGAEAFVAMHDLLFANQPSEGGAGLSDDQLVAYAVEAGAEEDAVRPLIEDKVFEQWVANATDAMSREGVNGTPGVLVDGELAEGDPTLAIDEALRTDS